MFQTNTVLDNNARLVRFGHLLKYLVQVPSPNGQPQAFNRMPPQPYPGMMPPGVGPAGFPGPFPTQNNSFPQLMTGQQHQARLSVIISLNKNLDCVICFDWDTDYSRKPPVFSVHLVNKYV